MMLETSRIEVIWSDLLDAHQAPIDTDPDLAPYLRIDTGELTCRMLMEHDDYTELVDDGRLLRIPTKTARTCFDQRRAFAETLCEPRLRADVIHALESESPFEAFDLVLARVPIEAERWREEERLDDLRRLEQWLLDNGLTPEPPAPRVRHIIEFPLRR